MHRTWNRLLLLTLTLAIGFAGLAGSAPPAFAGHRPELDRSASGPSRARASALVSREQLQQDLSAAAGPLGVRVSEIDERFGVPSFVWGSHAAAPAAGAAVVRPARTAEQAARAQLLQLAGLYHLSADDVSGAVLHDLHDTGRGGIIARFRQSVDGIEVFREETNVLMDRDLGLVSISGSVPSRALVPPASVATFALPADRAVSIALQDFSELPGEPTGAARLGDAEGGYVRFAAPAQLASLPQDRAVAQPLRAKSVYFREADALVPAYYVEVMGEGDAYSYVIAAEDGSVLFRHCLTEADAASYRVWASASANNLPDDGPQGTAGTPHPTALPDGYAPAMTAPSLITLQNGPISTNDPWLPPGATQTTGNNVDAYADLVAPDGFSAGDLRATTTSPGAFDRLYDTSQPPAASANQQMAAITQLFYDTNYFHDWYYDAGYNEAAGNMQTDNLGRGGIAGDALHAEAQDYSGLNNANMSTPADGASGRMQMYVFVNSATSSHFSVLAPAAIAGDYAFGTAAFGPQLFDLTGQVVQALDAAVPAGDGCTAFTNPGAIAGHIALIDRGTCAFVTKVQNAMDAGAIGVIIVDNVVGGTVPIGMSGTLATSLPVMSVTAATGDLIKAQLAAGVSVRMVVATPIPISDGAIDNQIVAHEWGHSISNRLIGNANGLSNNVGGGMGEGWADFHAMLMTVRPEDALAANNANFSGTYGLAGYACDRSILPTNSYYYGIRRYPYSTDMNKNPLTFKHIQDSAALPVGPPVNANSSANSEPHNTGEVWCAMLWECYASLLRDTGRLTFAQARDRMRDELVAAYKLTPSTPTFVDARDALLAAAYATDPQDFALFWAAFAKRGLGVGAVAPPRTSNTNSGVVESFLTGGDIAVTPLSLSDDQVSCDHDGFVDAGESGKLRFRVTNRGSGPLAATVVTVSANIAGVVYPGGNTLNLPPIGVMATLDTAISVGYSAVAGPVQPTFTVQANDPSLAPAGPRSGTLSAWMNTDLAFATTDNFEEPVNAWTTASEPPATGAPWSVVAGGANHLERWRSSGVTELQSLISPPIQVPASGGFDFTFFHAYSMGVNTAGGVIELTADHGATWTDIGAFASPTYDRAVTGGASAPLNGRLAYGGNSVGFPAWIPVTVSLGNAYAGLTVQIRFRCGVSSGIGGLTWNIDGVALTNAANAPFQSYVADPGHCLVTATQLALVSSAIVNGAADLAWYTADGAREAVTIYRREAPNDFAPVASLFADGDGFVRYSDPAIVAGHRYEYEVGVTNGGAETRLGYVALDVPAASTAPRVVSFAITSGNVASGPVRFRFGLPAAQRVHVALYDVAGREAATLADGEFTAGWHDLAWTGAGSTHGPGLYFARLSAGGKQLSQRVIMIP